MRVERQGNPLSYQALAIRHPDRWDEVLLMAAAAPLRIVRDGTLRSTIRQRA
jgi:hypothetical protein